jgi:flagellar biosynthesis/type III secretory pathway M-ring protein FliF/YscJ
LFFILKRSRPKAAEPASPAEATSLPEVLAAPNEATPPVPVPARAGKSGAVAQPIMEDPQKVYIREQILTLGKSNPATVAQLIQTWMDEDRRN